MEESWLISTLSRALAFGTPLLWAALGEVYAERAGVVNLGVEGVMALGALGGFAVALSTGDPVLGILVGAGVGTLAGLVHALVAVVFRANQYVSGLALSILGLGLSGLLGRGLEGKPLFNALEDITVPGLSSLLGGQSPLTYIGLAVAVLLWALLYHTRLGLVLRSVGEAPASADAAGVNVVRVRVLAVAFGGLMAGVAGAFLSVAYRPSWTEGMTGGLGFIAVAIAIFAAWNPLGAVAGALFFGGLYHLSFRLQNLFPPELLKSMPYLFVVLVLVLNALGKHRRQGGPESLGLPYRRGER